MGYIHTLSEVLEGLSVNSQAIPPVLGVS